MQSRVGRDLDAEKFIYIADLLAISKCVLEADNLNLSKVQRACYSLWIPFVFDPKTQHLRWYLWYIAEGETCCGKRIHLLFTLVIV